MSKLTKEQKQEIRDREHAERMILRKTSAAFVRMSNKIGECLDRAVSNSPHGTVLKVDDDTWIIRDTGLTI